jgi:uracil phosphoribosyltransferase
LHRIAALRAAPGGGYNGVMTAQETLHRYGPRVNLLADPYVSSLVARIGAPATKPPLLLDLVRHFYALLLARAAAVAFPASEQAIDTRMRARDERGTWRGKALDPTTKVVVANVMRAGNLPATTCFEQLCGILDPDAVRVDHFYFARRVDRAGRVIGVDSAGSKIGGGVEGTVLLIPDPMGATGSTTLETLAAYRERGLGRPRLTLAMHLIVTPEYLRRVLAATEDVMVFAGRVDRGNSPQDVLATLPGTHPERESGLDEVDYIVPGAGGIGEVLTNAFC